MNMVARQVRIIECFPSRLEIAPVAPDCRNCGGRCSISWLFRRFVIPMAGKEAFAVGEKASLYVEESILMRAAFCYYGLPLAALLTGSLLGAVFNWSDAFCATAGFGAFFLCQTVLLCLRPGLKPDKPPARLIKRYPEAQGR